MHVRTFRSASGLISAINSFCFSSCLIHGDFGPSNILFEPTHGQISGIIDFGGSGIGDPVYVLGSLIGIWRRGFGACAKHLSRGG